MEFEKIVRDNLKLIYKIAGYFYNVDKEDLVQAGALGLIKAYKKYDPRCGAKFSTYAHDYIYGEMYLLASRKILKVNKDTLKLYKYVEKSRYENAQVLGYVPNNYELASILNLDINMIEFACASVKELIPIDSEDDKDRSIHETYADKSSYISDDIFMLYDTLEKVPEPEKTIIIDRFLNDETQATIAKKLAMTQVMVSRLEKKGIARMREYMS